MLYRLSYSPLRDTSGLYHILLYLCRGEIKRYTVSMPERLGELRKPSLNPLEVGYLINNNLTETALAALIINEAQQGRLHIRELLGGYRVSINRGAYLDTNPAPAPMLNCLIATTDLALDQVWDMPPPPSDEEMIRAKEKGPERWSHLYVAGQMIEKHLLEKGYLRPMQNRHADTVNHYGRWAWMGTGGSTGGVLLTAGAPASVAFVGGVMVAAATSGLQRRVFFSTKATEVESVDAGRFTSRGQAAIAEIQQLHIAMKAIVTHDLALSASKCRELLPYYPVLRIEDWLGTSACKSAFRRPPHWLRPLNRQESGAVSIEKLTKYCLDSAWQPGEVHLRGRLSASLLRQKAREVTQEALRDSAPESS